MVEIRTKAASYVEAARSMQWAELRVLWEAIKRGKTTGWPPGKALEYLVVRAFELERLVVAYPYEVSVDNDVLEQIDGIVYLNELAFIIECKDTALQDADLVRKTIYQLSRRPPATMACIVITGRLTESAKTLAKWIFPHRIVFWQPADIEQAIDTQSFKSTLIEKYRSLCKNGLLDFPPDSNSLRK
jgi:hypothetical protein